MNDVRAALLTRPLLTRPLLTRPLLTRPLLTRPLLTRSPPSTPKGDKTPYKSGDPFPGIEICGAEGRATLLPSCGVGYGGRAPA